MKINLTKLENVVPKEDGRTVARCPACASLGGDKRGNNLVVYSDGKFGCIAFPEDKAHNKMILEKVGMKGSNPDYRFKVEPLRLPESKVLMKIGTLKKVQREEKPRNDISLEQE